MLKIGDFAREANVTVKTLRFYASEGLLSPGFIDRLAATAITRASSCPRSIASWRSRTSASAWRRSVSC